jgi:hypothetical protein
MPKIDRDYGISPYQSKVDQDTQQDDFAYIDQMETPTWFHAMSLALQKHSELIKPYQNESYPEAEHFYPSPLYQPPPGQPTQSYLGMGGDGCVITCFSPLYCTDPVKCHPAIYSTPAGVSYHEGLSSLEIKVLVNGVPAKVVTKGKGISAPSTAAGHTGPLNKITPPPAGSNVFLWEVLPPNGSWPFWPDNPMAKLKAKMRDGAKHVCGTSLDVFCRRQDCCLQDGYVAVSIDEDSTPDTITAGGSISVYILNGCPPFTWQATGTGYSFTSSSTQGRVNTLNCVAGTCAGGQFSSHVNVTVTDKCGHSDSLATPIINTSGAWYVKAGFQPENCNAGGLCVCSPDVPATTSYQKTDTGYPVRWTGYYASPCSVGCNSTQINSMIRVTAVCGASTVLRTAMGVPAHPTACWGGNLHSGLDIAYWLCASGECS